MKLFTFPLSGHAHRAELFLSLTGIEHSLVPVALGRGEHKQPDFLARNVFGQVPVLEDEGPCIPDSNAILVYLARKYDLTDWYPIDPAGAAAVQRWLSIAAGPIAFGPAAARLVTVFGVSRDPDPLIDRAHALYRVVETHLEGRTWLASDAHPTLADVAFYSYTAGAPEGNVDLDAYPNVRALLARVEALPGFKPFPQTAAGLRANA